ncbi:MAG: preprotein translocase subunit YajC [Candidatus Acidiferrales bacterium]
MLTAVAVALALQTQQQPQMPAWMQWAPFVVVLAVFYFLLILPAQRERKRKQQMLAALKPGDKVITTGGLYGTVVGLKDEVVQLRIADQVRVEVGRFAIAGKQPEKEESAKS